MALNKDEDTGTTTVDELRAYLAAFPGDHRIDWLRVGNPNTTIVVDGKGAARVIRDEPDSAWLFLHLPIFH